MAQHTGLLLPASVIIHLANILFEQTPQPYIFFHVSFQGFDENVLKPISQNAGYSVQQEYGFPDYVLPLGCV